MSTRQRTPEDSRDSSPGSEVASTKSKASIRVSNACLPCRSKHIKCDATMPTCRRCALEQKPCFYAQSRRGNKKRAATADKEAPPDRTETQWPLPQLANLQLPVRVINSMPAGWSVGKPTASNPVAATAVLLDHFYTNCYNTYSFTMPRHNMMALVACTPVDLQFLVTVFAYVASLYDPTISTDELRDAAYNQAYSSLPMTSFTVQGLLILALTALGENKASQYGELLDMAIHLATDIGMHHQAFAVAESDPVVAESHRRTWWSLYMNDCHRSLIRNLPTFALYGCHITTDMPCEEWAYQSGSIPTPISLALYDSRDPVDEPTFSSWTYAVDLFRLIGEVILPLKLDTNMPWYEDMRRAETRLTNWLVRIPKWKKEVVDASGAPDYILYIALGTAYGMQIRLRQPFRRLQLGLKDGFALGPLERPQQLMGALKLDASWGMCPAELAAVYRVCDHMRMFLTPSICSPLAVVVTEILCLGLLDACVFLGCDTAAVRERLSLAFGIMKKQAEIWPIAKQMATDIKAVAAAYLPSAPAQHQHQHQQHGAALPISLVGSTSQALWQEPMLPAVTTAASSHMFYAPMLHHTMSPDDFNNWMVE